MRCFAVPLLPFHVTVEIQDQEKPLTTKTLWPTTQVGRPSLPATADKYTEEGVMEWTDLLQTQAERAHQPPPREARE